MTLKHQYSSTGSHRIAKLDIAGFLERAGDWTSYQNIATITVGAVTYMAVTDYFSGGAIEADVIYQLHKTEFKSEGKGE